MKPGYLTFEEFRELALKTESLKNPLTPECEALGLTNRILHCVIGVSSEQDEYTLAIDNKDRTNALEELGDMLWYAAILQDAVGFELGCTVANEYPIYGLDAVKKTLFYGKELDIEDIKMFGCNVVNYADSKICMLGGEPGEVMYTIIAKLKARYGDKFDAERTGNRDLDKERAILEKGFE